MFPRLAAAALFIAASITAPVQANAVGILGSGHNTHIAMPSAAVPKGAALFAVAGTSADDVWAVGDSAPPDYGSSALIEHFDGVRWSIVRAPKDAPALTAVAAVSPSDAWAVGTYVQGVLIDGETVLHWNGSVWSSVTSPHPYALWTTIIANSATNVTLYGAAATVSADAVEMITAHWDGTGWTVQDRPDVPIGVVSAARVRSGDTIVVGNNFGYECCFFTGSYLEHDGLWTDAGILRHHQPYEITAVTAVGNGALALGFECRNAAWCQWRWDGTRWRDVFAQNASQCRLRTLFSRATSAWAAGACIERWGGHAFQIYAQLPAGDTVYGGTVTPDGSTWAVGARVSPSGQSRPLILRIGR